MHKKGLHVLRGCLLLIKEFAEKLIKLTEGQLIEKERRLRLKARLSRNELERKEYECIKRYIKVGKKDGKFKEFRI